MGLPILLHIVKTAALAGMAGYLFFCIFMAVTQSRMVYQPYPDITVTPADAGLAYEDVSFRAADGTLLHGWFTPADNERCVVLFCHGNGGNLSNRVDLIGIYNLAGISTFFFDYRGYGRSGGSPTERGTGADAEAARRYLTETRGIDPSRIVIHGRSLGGAVAARLAIDHPPPALILDSAFTSIEDMGSNLYPWLPVRLLSRFHYPTIEHVRRVKCPVLVIHSRADDIVPWHHGRALFEAAPEPKEFLEIRGSHNDNFLVTGADYYRGIGSFISRHTGM